MNGYFVINAKLPSLNEYVNVCRRNKYQAAQYKRDVEEVIGWAIRQAVTAKTLKPVKNPCVIHFEYHEATRKRDCDNIASAKKFILDALQKENILQGDGQKYVIGFTDSFKHDKKDFVVVTIEECSNEN